MAGGGVDYFDLMAGSIIGILFGILFGVSFYFGLLKFTTKYVFRMTSALLILLAAGLASQLADNLAQADVISVLTEPLWDSSWLISNSSLTGSFMHSLFGYTSNPSSIELIFYFTTLIALTCALNVDLITKKTQK